jgi:glycosyltransferase involved in cell wall biosynthesis
MALKISVIVCAHNEARYLAPCLHSLLAQSRLPDEVLVINNASTDETRAVAMRVPSVLVVDEPRKGLVIARETGRRVASGDVLVDVDADCRVPIGWLARVEQRFLDDPWLLALSGPYRYYDWDWWGRTLIRTYDVTGRRENWQAVSQALRSNVNVALTLFRRAPGRFDETPTQDTPLKTGSDLPRRHTPDCRVRRVRQEFPEPHASADGDCDRYALQEGDVPVTRP